MNELIQEEYKRIKKHHWESELYFFARINLGGSIIRVFKSGTKNKLVDALKEINVKELQSIKSQRQFKAYFEKNLSKFAKVIKRTSPKADKPSIYPGYQWGHGTKILCLFLRDTVLHSRRFSKNEVARLSNYLYIPIDGIVMKELKKLKYNLPFSAIKEIDTKKKFYDVQETLYQASKKVGIPRIWFDDIWADRP